MTSTSSFFLVLAARHLDPDEGIMRAGHVVTGADLEALRQVLNFVSAGIAASAPAEPASAPPDTSPQQQFEAQLRVTLHARPDIFREIVRRELRLYGLAGRWW